jgi:threonine synthase
MSSRHVTGLRCVLCGSTEHGDDQPLTCPSCGPAGTLDIEYDHAAISASWTRDDLAADPDLTMWRWRPLLPIADDAALPPLSVGGTPLYDAARLAEHIGVGRLWVKDEGRQPTASLKDRASAMAVVNATETGASVITTASTGNAAAALAGVAATVALDAVIFVPKTAPEAKIAQLLAYGSTVVLVEGSYHDAFELCTAAVDRYGWYNRNTGVNPFMTEGKKTVVLELCEQLDWRCPDAVFVSVGDGSIIGGVHKGLKDLLALGWIDRVPRIFGIQAAGSDYLVQAFETGEDVATKPPITASTVADSIAADLPRDRVKAMAAVVDSGGAFLRVPDEAILAAIPTMAQGCGVFAEPAAAAALAGLEEAVRRGLVGGGDAVAVLSTGSGLKDVRSVMAAVAATDAEPITIPPDLDTLATVLESADLSTEEP